MSYIFRLMLSVLEVCQYHCVVVCALIFKKCLLISYRFIPTQTTAVQKDYGLREHIAERQQEVLISDYKMFWHLI